MVASHVGILVNLYMHSRNTAFMRFLALIPLMCSGTVNNKIITSYQTNLSEIIVLLNSITI